MYSTDQFARTRRVRRGAGLAVGLLIVAGCGSSDGGASDEDLRDPTKSPLAQLLGYDVSPADQRAKDLQVQQSIVECMKADGWEYQAVDYNVGNTYADEYEEQVTDPVGYGEKYGYGIVRGYDLGQDQSAQTFEDPNSDYVNSLNSDEQTQYYESLYGDQSNFEAPDDGEEFTPPPLEEQGCQGKAQLEVYGDSPFNDPDISQRLGEIMDDAQNDPAVKDATDAWAACMTKIDESYEWKSPDEIYSYLYDKLNTAQGYSNTVTTDGDGGVITEAVPVGGDGSGDQPEVDEQAIEDLRAEELQIWADDQRCQDEVDMLQVRRDAEQRAADQMLEEFPDLGDQPGS
jgi:hypothetical protein